MKNEIVGEWFERGKHDLDAARIVMEENGYPDVIMMLLHQALEKYIKGYLIMQGWKLKKIHDLEMLFTEAAKHDKSFIKHLNLGRVLTAYYYENRYPPGPIPGINKKKNRNIYNTTLRIIKLFEKSRLRLLKGIYQK